MPEPEAEMAAEHKLFVLRVWEFGVIYVHTYSCGAFLCSCDVFKAVRGLGLGFRARNSGAFLFLKGVGGLRFRVYGLGPGVLLFLFLRVWGLG